MSGGKACTCTFSAFSRPKWWRVLQRYGNSSAFNGYKWTPSAYSSITCLNCHNVWRTKAAYVAELVDFKS